MADDPKPAVDPVPSSPIANRLPPEEREIAALQATVSRLGDMMERDDEAPNRQKAVVRLRFRSGDQWEPDLAAERAAAPRPKLTINKIPKGNHA